MDGGRAEEGPGWYRPPEERADAETVNVRADSETHIGMERKAGGWLESETDRILRFAGMTTQRERTVVFDEPTGEHYRVDILARFADLTLFVECKDHADMKVSEKILFTLVGQVNDYRRGHPDETVVGILVTSARNAGQNSGIRNRLEREGCRLWDGSTIQRLQEKMVESDRKSEFAEYLFERIGYVLDGEPAARPGPGEHVLHARMHFFSIPELRYVGGRFSLKSVIADMGEVLDGTGIRVASSAHKVIDSPEGRRMSVRMDFERVVTEEEVMAHWKSKSKMFRKPKEPPLRLMELRFASECAGALSRTYGVELDPGAGRSQKRYGINCIATRSQ